MIDCRPYAGCCGLRATLAEITLICRGQSTAALDSATMFVIMLKRAVDAHQDNTCLDFYAVTFLTIWRSIWARPTRSFTYVDWASCSTNLPWSRFASKAVRTARKPSRPWVGKPSRCWAKFRAISKQFVQ